MRAPPLRRDKSYRKPVPQYIPSPPESPKATTPDFSKGQDTLVPLELVFLPLPGDLQEFVEHERSPQEKRMDPGQDNSLTSVLQETEVYNPRSLPRVSSFIRSASHTLFSEKSPDAPANPLINNKRRLPQVYRPPTPPIASAAKKRKFTDDSSVDTHEFLTVPPRVANPRHGETSAPLTRSTTAAGSSRSSFHPLSTQASFRTEKTFASDAPTFIVGSAMTNNTSRHTDGHQEEHWHDLPVLPMFIIKPSPRRRGSGLTGSTKLGSDHPLKARFEWFTVQRIGRSLQKVFCCCFHEVAA
ncbi:hypothetical protein D9757_002732 [Collybiopsis confluens]|uniref:Uncharacterized protein n=1 Tax=Collybiopsis confluens TaxID=2823264 RepID=A0A8H5HVV6_9AGAR|nr:hypothetical protein D9757_002732 [Collybiopsis confluens]